MRYLITGAGQIGTQLALDFAAAGHDTVVLRRGNTPLPGTLTSSGDAGDRIALRAAAAGVDAIFHCIHAAYSAKTWLQELPHRETAVMDIAAELDIPVVFPESVYAFGQGAQHLLEDSPLAPVSPLGRVRAQLLKTRASHTARTASVVASDLLGPTSTKGGSVVLGTLLTPASKGARAWAMGDPDAPHAITYTPDLTRAMLAAVPLARQGGVTLLAPTAPARSQRLIVANAAAAAGLSPAGVTRIPTAAFALGALFAAPMRELFHQRYLWNAPSELLPGLLTTELGLLPTPWERVLEEWASQLTPGRAARP